MSKLQCPCGEIINVTNHINEFELVPNEWIEGIMEKIEENALMSEDCIFQSFWLYIKLYINALIALDYGLRIQTVHMIHISLNTNAKGFWEIIKNLEFLVVVS